MQQYDRLSQQQRCCLQYDRLKKSLVLDFCFYAIRCASRPVVRAKTGTELGVLKQLTNYQTGGYKIRLTIGWKGRIRFRTSRSFMNLLRSKSAVKFHRFYVNAVV